MGKERAGRQRERAREREREMALAEEENDKTCMYRASRKATEIETSQTEEL